MARSKRTRIPSPNKKEYDRLRRNIIARMRYREKQDFKVDYTTKPKLIDKPTKRDIERLKNYKVGLNEFGEVVAVKPRSKAYVSTNFKGVTPSQLYTQNTSEDYYPHRELEVDLDYIGMIYGVISDIQRRGNAISYDEIGHGVSDNRLLEIMTAWRWGYEEIDKTIDEQIEKHGSWKVNAYYKERFEDISIAVSKMLELYLSDPEEIKFECTKIAMLLVVP